MIDLRPVIQIVGLILCMLAAAMTVPAMVDLLVGHWEWQVFMISAGVTLFCGLAMVLGTRMEVRHLSVRQTYLATAFGWIMPCLFAALPLAFGPA
ncbi:MAG: potassium transporter TrkH, partial [Magnetospirillum sp.]|nr:potassium transporter TrkH [Magnetospirillum sp.]